MLSVTEDFKARLAREDLSLCRIVAITLRNGEVYRYTTLDEHVKYQGEIYSARPGIKISSIRRTKDAKTETSTIDVGYMDGFITEEMTRRNAVDGATFIITLVDYLRPELAGMVIQEGDVYNVATSDRFTASLSCGSYSGVDYQIGEQYSMKCRNVFCDDRCGLNIEDFSKEFTVLGVEPNQVVLTLSTTIGGSGPAPDPDALIPPDATYGPGVHNITVPEAGVIMTVAATSAGGGAGSSSWRGPEPGAKWYLAFGFLEGQEGFRKFPDWLHKGFDGANGGDTKIGDLAVIPGGGGGLGCFYEKGMLETANFRREPAPAPLATTGFNSESVGGGGKGGVSQKELGLEALYNRDFRGQDGGAGSQGIRVLVSGVDVQPGAVLRIEVGAGGAAGDDDDPTPGKPFTMGTPGTPGEDGSVTITYSRNAEVEPQAYDLGSILWLSGRNTGDVAHIAANNGPSIALAAPMSYAIRVGDRGKFRAGCSYYANMCEDVYDNLKNMEAEPAVPLGSEDRVETPLTKAPEDQNRPAIEPYNTSLVPAWGDTSKFRQSS